MLAEQIESERQRRLRGARRVVVKVGTSTVTGKDGEISIERVEPIVRSLAALKKEGRQFVLVSSGAVGLGAGRLGLHSSRLRDLVTRQACAAVGQNLLMHAYERLFGAHGVKIAQVLLTEDDFTNWRRYTNLRLTMERLLKLGVLPIINENDTVSTAELEYVDCATERTFGDNDRLAALVASKLDSDALLLLTNVDGLLRRDSIKEDARPHDEDVVIPYVEEITPELKALAAGPSAGGRGGMLTKLEAAQIAMRTGSVAVIANGARPGTIERVLAGEPIGTLFISALRMPGKRRWIAYAAGTTRGRLIVNEGARAALMGGKASLLSSGVVGVEKQFEPQDVVSIADCDGQEFARGIVNCASAEVKAELEATAVWEQEEGERVKPPARVLVTRDNIVLLEQR